MAREEPKWRPIMAAVREHIGYEDTLRAAVGRAHSVFIRAHTPGCAAAESRGSWLSSS